MKAKYGCSYALVMDPVSFGAYRCYKGFIPLSPPSGYTHLRIYMVRLEDNTVAGYYETSAHAAADGKWDVPGYEGLKKAVRRSLANALHDAYLYFCMN